MMNPANREITGRIIGKYFAAIFLIQSSKTLVVLSVKWVHSRSSMVQIILNNPSFRFLFQFQFSILLFAINIAEQPCPICFAQSFRSFSVVQSSNHNEQCILGSYILKLQQRLTQSDYCHEHEVCLGRDLTLFQVNISLVAFIHPSSKRFSFLSSLLQLIAKYNQAVKTIDWHIEYN